MKRLPFFLLLAVFLVCPGAGAEDKIAEPAKKEQARPASWFVEKISKFCKNEPLRRLSKTKDSTTPPTELTSMDAPSVITNAEMAGPRQAERDPVNDGLRPYIDLPPAPLPPRPASKITESNSTNRWLAPFDRWRKRKDPISPQN
jgi:hypothetical protein